MALQTPAANPALASLRDIQTPVEIGLWPIAYGYWILIIIALMSSIAIFVYLSKRRKHNAAKRAALIELAELDLQATHYIANVSAVLKRAAMSYCERNLVASLSGSTWHKWLSQQVKQPPTELCELLSLSYQQQPLTESQAIALKQCAEQWLKNALPLSTTKSTSNKLSQMEAK